MNGEEPAVLRILIVDDSPEDREFIRHLLSGPPRPCHCSEATSGAAGLSACLDHPEGPPDCVLLDYHLPDYEAPEVLAALGGPGLTYCPVVVVTGSAGLIDGKALLRLGAQDFIGKNWMNAESLIRCVENAIERFGMVRELREREARLKLALEVSHTFAFDWDPATDQVLSSDNYQDILGQPEETAIKTGHAFLQRVHPDDRARFLDRLRHLSSDADSYQIEYRWVRDDGAERVLAESGRGFFDSRGHLRRLVGATTNITEQRHSAQALQETERRFRQMAEAIGEVFWLSLPLSQQVLYVSPAFEHIWGQPCADLYANPRLWLEAVLPEDRPAVRHHLEVLSAGGNYEHEYRIRRPDGSLRWVRERAYAYRDDDGTVTLTSGVASDITQGRLATDALRESETLFRTLFESSADALSFSDEHGFIDCNGANLRLFGCDSRDDLLADYPTRFSPPTQPDGGDSQTLAKERIAAAFHEGHQRFEWVHRRRDGSEFSADVSLIRVDLPAKPMLLGTVRDLTEQKAMLAALATAKEAAERANADKSLFLANMSHEIRTPMNAIMGMTELCLEADPSERQRHYLNRIRMASDALRRIIDDILDFSKIEAGRLDMVAEPFTLAGALETLVALLYDRARDKGLALVMALDPELAGRVWWGDSQRLGQVLTNLVGNAIKFSSRGQVAVGVAATGPAEADGRVTLRFTVRDEGIGITPADQARLFQPFTQADATNTRTYGGTGLGLAISRRLVELMGGRIQVESTLGQGSTFSFTARFAPSDQAPAPRLANHRPRLERTALAGLRGADILLVEDTELNQEVIRDLLEGAGLRVRLAANGQEALDAVALAIPDGVLMDCQMPVMDGFEATRRLRAAAAYRDLPIIALTANALAGEREKCLACGMNGYLSKPVDFGALYAALVQWVRPRAGTAEEGLDHPAPWPSPPPPGVEKEEERLPVLPGLDTTLGLIQSGGKAPFYEALLTRFRERHADGFLEQFRAAQGAGDWVTAARLAHTLKGSARTLGASTLGGLADALEEAARQGSPAVVTERLATLEGELELVLAGLARLGDPAAPPPPDPDPDALAWDVLVRHLDRLLEENDTAAVDCAAGLAAALAGSAQATVANAIAAAVACYDFAGARAALRHLIHSLGRPGVGDGPQP